MCEIVIREENKKLILTSYYSDCKPTLENINSDIKRLAIKTLLNVGETQNPEKFIEFLKIIKEIYGDKVNEISLSPCSSNEPYRIDTKYKYLSIYVFDCYSVGKFIFREWYGRGLIPIPIIEDNKMYLGFECGADFNFILDQLPLAPIIRIFSDIIIYYDPINKKVYSINSSSNSCFDVDKIKKNIDKYSLDIDYEKYCCFGNIRLLKQSVKNEFELITLLFKGEIDINNIEIEKFEKEVSEVPETNKEKKTIRKCWLVVREGTRTDKNGLKVLKYKPYLFFDKNEAEEFIKEQAIKNPNVVYRLYESVYSLSSKIELEKRISE